MKIGLTKLLILLALSHQVGATALPSEHFLYPRDKEMAWMTGLEIVLGHSGNNRLYDKCLLEEAFTMGTYQDFTCSMYKSSKVAVGDLTYALGQLESEQVVIVGEQHTYQKNQFEMAKAIEINNGFDVLALEMFNFKSQQSVDDFIEGRISLEELEVVFSRDWRYNLDGYLKMIVAAKEAGMKILALDDRESFKEEPFSDELRLRDQVMGNHLSKYLTKNPGDRILFYTGKLHAFKEIGLGVETIAQIIQRDHPAAKIGNVFLFNKKRKNLYSPLFKSQDGDGPFVLESQKLKHYTDMIIFH
ncbi:MAG: ChaN family lipoprotein [Bacteriovoracaceae bacterium]|nr:ChaN family lipoprotein [Bacteriovoracaceae bacterium]